MNVKMSSLVGAKKKKESFLKEGSRRVFYKSFALYFTNQDGISQLVVSDYRTGYANNYYYICRFDVSGMDADARKRELLRSLNCVIRKINNEEPQTIMKNI